MLRGIIFILISSFLLLSCGVKRPVVTSTVPYPQENKPEVQVVKQRTYDLPLEFRKVLKKRSADLAYPDLVYKFYESKGFQPVLVPRFLPHNQLDILLGYLSNAGKHGLDTGLFAPGQIRNLLNKMGKANIDTVVENHRNLSALEIAVASSLINYSITLQFGIVVPEKVYPLYSTLTAMPDSSSILKVFEIRDLKNYLDSIQPKDRLYLALQKSLSMMQGTTEPDSLQTLLVNLERLRWKNRPAQDKFVSVNIPNFSLDVISKGKSVLHMKVCVGEPEGWQTPQLGSMIHSVQVNPVWNIPQSIARDETSQEAARDRYYLANSNIKVYHKGKLITHTESIDWASVDVSEYTFQQQPGSENALGKIKFLFQNESSVYLHDTPVKSAFRKEIRAVSHGCVRVEKPLELTYVLFGKGEQFDQIKKAMQRGYPAAKFIALPEQVPIILGYYTAWLDDKGKLRFSKDIYGLDQLLYEAMMKINAGNIAALIHQI
ncbi:L,D-transpeptidase family protein [Pedobacter nyackensis]|uniref:L,D-transpeptidase family protein n=1 Tax=Pedobacter nyackensis TaxID=475255 RepID=UPI00292D25C1|nr:L,D-transpeptidase family protein [Pedobacter nyackensis]